jgi:hypothetical protein
MSNYPLCDTTQADVNGSLALYASLVDGLKTAVKKADPMFGPVAYWVPDGPKEA